MSWASRRRTLILAGIGALVLAAAVIIGIATFYEEPTCTDRTQNGDEQGVDCGGASCTYLCTALVRAPAVDFVRALSPAPGRTDIIAYVANPNPGIAARAAKYRVDLYAEGGALIKSAEGETDLPPGSVVPIYIPGFYAGYQVPTQAFLTFDADSLRWYAYQDDRVIPSVSDTRIESASTSPRVIATLANGSALPLYNVKTVIVVRDTGGQVVAASQTVVPRIPASGEAQATFTWNVPFPIDGPIEVRPVLPLPAP